MSDFKYVCCPKCGTQDITNDGICFHCGDIKAGNQWISVEDRLPEFRKRDELLVFDGEDIDLGAYYNGEWCYWSGAWKPFPNQTVTHWMPLPEPPQEQD